MNCIDEMMKILDIGYIGKCKQGMEYANSCKLKTPCEECKHLLKQYPDFTPEKQLEVIKLITSTSIKNDNSDNNAPCYIHALNPNLYEKDRWAIGTDYLLEQDETFENALAKAVTALINENELDKQEVKRILEE